ncbi:MAG: hypothetical protein HY746_01890 [Elusimicrobia bacterium]|nr:hypothetical protein [Elusimicrobiota bacterium]
MLASARFGSAAKSAVSHCYAAGINAGRTRLTVDEMKRAVNIYLKSASSEKTRVDKISISGGEPLTQWELLREFIPWISGKDVKVELFTNGLLLNAEKADFLVKHGIRLKISLDGYKTTHDRARITAAGSPTFDRIVSRILSMPENLRSSLEAVPTISSRRLSGLYEDMRFLLWLGFGRINPSFVLHETWFERDFKELGKQLKMLRDFTSKDKKAGLRLGKIFLKDLSKGLKEFMKTNEISIGTDGFFYPNSILSSSAPVKDSRFKDKYRVGNLETGIDGKKFGELRAEAWQEIKKTGAGFYLGCLLCMYYSSKLHGTNLEKLLLSGEKIAKITMDCRMGEFSG